MVRETRGRDGYTSREVRDVTCLFLPNYKIRLCRKTGYFYLLFALKGFDDTNSS